MKKKLWATLVAFIALMVFATSAFAAARWRNVASISPSISAGDNNYTCEISCLSGTTKIDCTLVLYEKGLFGTWAALHGWLGWLVVLYAVCMMLDWVTGTVLAIKNGVWSSHKARQGLWHKGGSIIMIFVSVLTDILLGLTLNHISGLTLPFSYDMLLTPIVLFWYIVSELGSILENAEKMGAPIPPLLKNILEKMRDSNDDKNTPSL